MTDHQQLIAACEQVASHKYLGKLVRIKVRESTLRTGIVRSVRAAHFEDGTFPQLKIEASDGSEQWYYIDVDDYTAEVYPGTPFLKEID